MKWRHLKFCSMVKDSATSSVSELTFSSMKFSDKIARRRDTMDIECFGGKRQIRLIAFQAQKNRRLGLKALFTYYFSLIQTFWIIKCNLISCSNLDKYFYFQLFRHTVIVLRHNAIDKDIHLLTKNAMFRTINTK